jgi:DNA-binding NtrC family response regulator
MGWRENKNKQLAVAACHHNRLGSSTSVISGSNYRVENSDVLKSVFRYSQAATRTDPDRFDVVITDQTMPQMTGEDFIHALRRLRPELPVILCTGFSHVMDAKRAQALGQVTFLMKPVDAYELGVLLQQLLVRQSKSP